jgi:hypothetical protein
LKRRKLKPALLRVLGALRGELYWRLLDFVPVNSQPLLAEANLLASTLKCSLDVNMKRRRCSMENSILFQLV